MRRALDGIDCQTASKYCFLSFTGVGGTVFSPPLAWRDRAKPDVVIRRRSDGVLFFDNIYTSTPTAYGHTIAPGGTWLFAVLVQNDSSDPGNFTVTAGSVAAPFSIQYVSGYHDVTSSVTGAGLVVLGVAPNTSRLFAVQFRADPATPIGATASVTFTATATDPGQHDAVKLRVTAST